MDLFFFMLQMSFWALFILGVMLGVAYFAGFAINNWKALIAAIIFVVVWNVFFKSDPPPLEQPKAVQVKIVNDKPDDFSDIMVDRPVRKTGPNGETVKGHTNPNGEKVYYTTESEYYSLLKHPKTWFKTEGAAKAAGYRKSNK